jgi:hypothetical protein
VAYSDRFAALCISRKLVRKSQKNLEKKEKEGWEGEESEEAE